MDFCHIFFSGFLLLKTSPQANKIHNFLQFFLKSIITFIKNLYWPPYPVFLSYIPFAYLFFNLSLWLPSLLTRQEISDFLHRGAGCKATGARICLHSQINIIWHLLVEETLSSLCGLGSRWYSLFNPFRTRGGLAERARCVPATLTWFTNKCSSSSSTVCLSCSIYIMTWEKTNEFAKLQNILMWLFFHSL